MKAITYQRYGSPDVLRLADIPKPMLTADDHVLVRVHAVSLNPLDWHLLRGVPYIVRPTAGWRTPKRHVPGVDVAGVVEAVGPAVTQVTPGDEVFAEKSWSCAEYVVGPERLWVAKPANLSFEQAAAIPAAGVTALQALRDHARLTPGQRVLINGASGGVGTFAVQIAKAFGAEVTGVTSSGNLELVRSLGADEVIDYTREDFTRSAAPYDVLIDNAANRTLWSMRRVLAPGGTLVLVGASKGNWIGPIVRTLAAGVLSRFGDRRMTGMLTDTKREDLLQLKELIEAGAVTPVIDRSYPLARTAEALRYLETMHARAKVVITIARS